MIRKTLLLFSLIIVINSCKENKKEGIEAEVDVKTEKKDEGIKNTFVVKLKGVFRKDDNFQVLYTEDKEESYTLKKIIRKKITGSNQEQELRYVLPKEIYPSKIRLDFGNNKEQGRIIINMVTFILDGQTLEISSTEFLSYFRPTQWINQIGVNNESEYNLIVKDVEVNGNTISYAPYFIATPKLIEALEAL